MKIELQIDCVDDTTVFITETDSARCALDFLSKHDHEGSSVAIKVTTPNPDEVYGILNYLQSLR